MAVTPSTMLPLGTVAPDFELSRVDGGGMVSLSDAAGRPLLIMFGCNHCPYVKHVEDEIGRLAADYAGRGIAIVAISSNDVDAYPDDSPEFLAAQAKRANWNFPYLYDETQDIARAYFAACTPDYFLFDADHRLYYRGRLDESSPGNGKELTGAELRGALDLMLDGKPAPEEQLPSMGCNIKWRD